MPTFTDRVAIDFRGSALREKRVESFENDLAQVVDLLENGPQGWVVARLDFLSDSLIDPFLVWRLELLQLRKEWCPPTDHRWTRPHRKAGIVEKVLS